MSINNLDLNLLKYFVAVAQEGNFTQAATKLHIEQPSVSRAIFRLEEELQVQLFVRTKRKVELTPKGQDLLIMAQNVLGLGAELVSRAQSKELDLSGTIKFAAESPLSSIFLPEVIQRLSTEYPKLWPMMFTGITSDLIKRIKNKELEFGLFFYTGQPLSGLHYMELMEISFKLVASPHITSEGMNSFVGSREVNDDKAGLPTFSKLKKINKQLKIKYSANDIVAYKELIVRGLGIGPLPEAMIKNELREKTLKVIYPEIKLAFPIVLVSRSKELSPEANRIVEMMKS